MMIGDPAPEFRLPGTDGSMHSLADFDGAPVLVLVQMCNHCPTVVRYLDRTIALARATAPQGVRFIGINSNDETQQPGDSFAAMVRQVAEARIPFPYLHDPSQDLARQLGAQRTPEYFVFDAARQLAYHGRLDDNRDDPDAVKHRWLQQAIDALLDDRTPDPATTDPVGCSVKWREA